MDLAWPIKIKTFFVGNETEAKMSPKTFVLNNAGVYFIFCDPELSHTIIRGTTVWKNPHGYLPAKLPPLRVLYGFMSLGYYLLGLVWFRLVRKDIKATTKIHWNLRLVLILSVCEMTGYFFEYAILNSTGRRPMKLTWWDVRCTFINSIGSLLRSLDFSSLARNLDKLQIKMNMAKHQLYAMYVLSIVWIGFECDLLFGVLLAEAFEKAS
ncbi:unnamed protein product [Eruca vesicaria subsp. sativa]|uniref:GOST seven transmembrane domain-containing protein n=1 Tax=Eruca vesicaria subsp. sativa TaxID=29727 RepID=A0ABC8IR74_ERUVS|nr:unnamed protein product [Eruca vesicaria subsp. sativa]